MTSLERRPIAHRVDTVGLAAAIAVLIVAAGAPPAQAQSAASEAPAAKPVKAPDVAAGPAEATKPAPAKAGPRKPAKAAKATAGSAAKSVSGSAAKAPPTKEPPAKQPATAGKATQVMDFDNDDVEGQRMEPGFELIQAGPRRARQPSLVTPLRPEDSVVRRE